MSVDPTVWQRKDRIEEARKNPVLHRRLLCLNLAEAKRNNSNDEIALCVMNLFLFFKYFCNMFLFIQKTMLEKLDLNILATHIFKTLSSLPSALNESENCSVIFMKIWLKSFASRHQNIFTTEELQMVNSLDVDYNIAEGCSICGEDILF